jgi:precorrin-2 dehydrogenase / sirohydrochlorin ferrochelatase
MVSRRPLYPVSLIVAGRRCLVVGGGPVAARKVEGLLAAGADVTVVAPEVVDQLTASAEASVEPGGGTLAVERRPYRSPEAADYRLVVTATGLPEVDGPVAADAEAAGVWINSADDLDHCTFTLPAVHRDGPVTVAVSTGGASPALAGWIRSRVAEAIGPEVAVVAGLLDEARAEVKAAGRSTEGLDWPAAIDAVVPLVRAGRTDEAREVLAAFTALMG